MAGTSTPIFEQTVDGGQVQILPADTTTFKTIFTATTNGNKVSNILVNSTDTSARDLLFVVTIAGTDYPLATVTCPLRSGDLNSTVPLAVFQHANFVGLNTDNNGNKFLTLKNGAALRVKSLTTVTAAKVISIFAQVGDY